MSSAAGSDTRRGFLGGLFLFAAGAVAASLGGCAADDDGHVVGVSPEGFAEETVSLRPGMRYQNTMPKRVPAVRKLADDAVRSAPLRAMRM
jgi:hypothetical protein